MNNHFINIICFIFLFSLSTSATEKVTEFNDAHSILNNSESATKEVRKVNDAHSILNNYESDHSDSIITLREESDYKVITWGELEKILEQGIYVKQRKEDIDYQTYCNICERSCLSGCISKTIFGAFLLALVPYAIEAPGFAGLLFVSSGITGMSVISGALIDGCLYRDIAPSDDQYLIKDTDREDFITKLFGKYIQFEDDNEAVVPCKTLNKILIQASMRNICSWEKIVASMSLEQKFFAYKNEHIKQFIELHLEDREKIIFNVITNNQEVNKFLPNLNLFGHSEKILLCIFIHEYENLKPNEKIIEAIKKYFDKKLSEDELRQLIKYDRDVYGIYSCFNIEGILSQNK